jgi:predicted transcriptional regulator
MPLPRPTDAELEILTVLWSQGPSTVRAVHEVITQRRPAQYTTTLKQLQIMDRKGLVRRDDSKRAHVYRAAQPREATQAQLAGDLLERAFAGSARELLMGALAARKASKKELAGLRDLLDAYERRKRRPANYRRLLRDEG